MRTDGVQMTRKILHLDCDCFYVSVEVRDHPALAGRPLAVGGLPEQRGVIASCNYEARRFGVHSAISSARAQRLCPDLTILPLAMEQYRAASRQILAIYREYTDRVEPLSLDEAYLDVSDTTCCQGSAIWIAEEIRARVAQEVGVTVSADVVPCKCLAKIASDWRKPNGLFMVRPHEVDAFIAQLPVSRLFGVGQVTAAKLQQMGVTRCEALRAVPLSELCHRFGVFGQRPHELCRGIDRREVQAERPRKSVSVETTYPTDLPTFASCAAEIPTLTDQLKARVARINCGASIHKLFIKIRFSDFQLITVECPAKAPSAARFQALLEQGLSRRKRSVRLLGVGVRLSSVGHSRQLALFIASSENEPSA